MVKIKIDVSVTCCKCYAEIKVVDSYCCDFDSHYKSHSAFDLEQQVINGCFDKGCGVWYEYSNMFAFSRDGDGNECGCEGKKIDYKENDVLCPLCAEPIKVKAKAYKKRCIAEDKKKQKEQDERELKEILKRNPKLIDKIDKK